MTVTDDPVPVTLNHGRKFLKRLKPLPTQLYFPVLKELPGPHGIVIRPQLPERFFEQICLVQPLVGF